MLDKFAAMQMLDVHFPTTDGRTLILSRYTQPQVDQKILVERLGLCASIGFGANYPLDKIKLTANGDLLVGCAFDRFDGVAISSLALLEGHLETNAPPVTLHVSKVNDEAVINYSRGSLQISTNLTTWDEVHSGGGEFRTNFGQSRQFYRGAP